MRASHIFTSRALAPILSERRATGQPTALVRPAAWTLREERWFVYEGWNLIAEFDKNPSISADAVLLHAYAWGSDLSRTFAGAGGVGGLLGQMDPSGQLHAVCTEIMGNVMGLVHVTPTTATLTDRYDYDAFGKQITHVHTDSTTTLATECPFGFSTKYTDEETGLCYYGYRYYSPEMGRWLNRDPIEEKGGVNVYGMVGNDPKGRLDCLGLFDYPPVDDPFRRQPLPPSDPNAPSSPSIFDNWKEGGEVNNNAWFEKNLPKWVEGSKKLARRKVEMVLKEKYRTFGCSGQPFKVTVDYREALRPSLNVGGDPEYDNGMGTFNLPTPSNYINPNANDYAYGDPPLSHWDANRTIGRCQFQLVEVEVIWDCNDCTAKWKGDLRVHDNVGVTPSEDGYVAPALQAIGVKTNHELKRTKWPLEGVFIP